MLAAHLAAQLQALIHNQARHAGFHLGVLTVVLGAPDHALTLDQQQRPIARLSHRRALILRRAVHALRVQAVPLLQPL
mgnify:CR=1 FL=1